jgi:hypothetical protein
MKKFKFILFLLILAGLATLSWAEDLVITTYYPAPTNSVRDGRFGFVAVGDDFRDSSVAPYQDGVAVATNKVGIGTPTPKGKLEIIDPYLGDLRLANKEGTYFAMWEDMLYNGGIDNRVTFSHYGDHDKGFTEFRWRNDDDRHFTQSSLLVLANSGAVGIGTSEGNVVGKPKQLYVGAPIIVKDESKYLIGEIKIGQQDGRPAIFTEGESAPLLIGGNHISYSALFDNDIGFNVPGSQSKELCPASALGVRVQDVLALNPDYAMSKPLTEKEGDPQVDVLRGFRNIYFGGADIRAGTWKIEVDHPAPRGPLKLVWYSYPATYIVKGFKQGDGPDYWMWGVEQLGYRFVVIRKVSGKRPRPYLEIYPEGYIVVWDQVYNANLPQ